MRLPRRRQHRGAVLTIPIGVQLSTELIGGGTSPRCGDQWGGHDRERGDGRGCEALMALYPCGGTDLADQPPPVDVVQQHRHSGDVG